MQICRTEIKIKMLLQDQRLITLGVISSVTSRDCVKSINSSLISFHQTVSVQVLRLRKSRIKKRGTRLRIDCSSPLFLREIVGPTGRHLDLLMRAKQRRVQNARPWVGAVNNPYPRAFCTLPSFAPIKGPRWRPIELNDRHLRSHGKIGDCE